jgi:hypothetical protein
MKKYYCSKCSKHHYRGKIYKDHIEFKKQEIDYESSNSEDIDFTNLKNLRPIAKRQILKLIRKMNTSKKPGLYKNQIKRVIEYENKNY